MLNKFMWLINFIPESMIHLILVLGILGTVASFVMGIMPFIKRYQLPLQIISILILAFALYMEGGLALKNQYELAVQKMQTKMAEAAAEAAKVNAQIIQKYADKQAQNDNVSNSVSRYIEKETIKIDQTCVVAPEAVVAHNAAASKKLVEEMPITLQSAVESAEHNKAAKGKP